MFKKREKDLNSLTKGKYVYYDDNLVKIISEKRYSYIESLYKIKCCDGSILTDISKYELTTILNYINSLQVGFNSLTDELDNALNDALNDYKFKKESESKSKSKLNIKNIHLNKSKRTGHINLIVELKDGKRGISKCDPKDEFNMEIAFSLAYLRAMLDESTDNKKLGVNKNYKKFCKKLSNKYAKEING